MRYPSFLASLAISLSVSAPIAAQAQWQDAANVPQKVWTICWDASLGGPAMLTRVSNTSQRIYGPAGEIGMLPAPVSSASIAYDTARDLLVVLGKVNNVWTIYEGRTQWTSYPVQFAPSIYYASIGYDATRGTIVLAGQDSYDLRLYDWSGGTASLRLLTQRHGSAAPQLIHHAGDGRLWLLEDSGTTWWTWAFDGVTLQPLGGTAPAIAHLNCAYDPLGDRVLATGGFPGALISPDNVNTTTWAYDGASWTPLGTSNPQPGHGPTCTDPNGSVVVHCDMVWLNTGRTPWSALLRWNGAAFQVVPDSETPSPLSYSDTGEALFDPDTETTLAGFTYQLNGTLKKRYFEYDGRFWTSAPTPPGTLIGYHEGIGRRVAFGYVNGQPHTWHFVNGSWALMTQNGPAPGPFWAWAWDGTAVILFGWQLVAGVSVPQTWAWNGQQWSLRTPAHSPTWRFNPKMVFDANRRRVVLFGGMLGTQSLNDTWEWDGNDWTLRAQGPMPGPVYGQYALAWHASRARTVLRSNFGQGHDFFEWNGVQWQALTALGATPQGEALLMATPDGEVLSVGVSIDRLGSVNPASYRAIGPGCSGTAGTPTLGTAPHDQPWQGDWIEVRVGTLPANTPLVFLLTGFSTTSWQGVPLPLALAPLGAGPCELRVAADLVIPAAVIAGEGRWGTEVPPAPAFLGLQLHQQALVPDPAANAFGWVLSNAATLTIGRR